MRVRGPHSDAIDAGEHWIGWDIGWMIFGVVGLLGVAVLAGNLVVGAPSFINILVLGLYGAGWIVLGRLVQQLAALRWEELRPVVS